MSLQRQQRRSSEVRGCLLRNYLDMRKRSLIRSESEDSGFALETYEPRLSSSFDAEKFLEELGFAGDSAPLIPDRFIPSLIHRISNMPDETVLKLDTRVWNSIDSFKKKEHTVWFFTQSSVECDLCLNELHRSYSLPAEFVQDCCDSLHPGGSIYSGANNNNIAFGVQNWLSRFPADGLAVADKSKANIAYIGNQSSTESGVLSALSDDEAYTTTNHAECLSEHSSYRRRERVDDFVWSLPEVESSNPPSGLAVAECRTFPSSTPSGQVRETRSGNPPSHLVTTPSCNCGTQPSKTASDVCIHEMPSVANSGSFLNTHYTARKRRQSDFLGKNVTQKKNPSKSPTEVATSNGKGDLNEVLIFGQLRSVNDDMDSDMENGNINDSIYVNDETEGDDVKDADGSSRGVSPARSDDVRFDRMKKRHSFDSAYFTAAEKRRRFRLSHSKTHNFLFEKQDSHLSASHLNEMNADDATSCDSVILRNFQEEIVEHSDELKHREEEGDFQGISHHNGNNLYTPLEVYDTVSNVDTLLHNGDNLDTPLEVSDVISNVDTSLHNGDNLDIPLEVSDVISNVDTSLHNGDNLDTPLEVSDVISNVDTSHRNGGTHLELSGVISNVDTSHHNGGNLDTHVEVSDVISNVDTSHHNGGTHLEVSDVISNVDTSHHNGGNLATPLEVSDVISNVATSLHNEGNLDTHLEVSDVISSVDTSHHYGGNLATPLEVSDVISNVDTSHHNGGNLAPPLEVSGFVSNVETSHHNRGNVATPLEVSGFVSNVETSHHNGGNVATPLGVSGVVSSIEQFKAREVLSRSDSESSERYFSCDEHFTPKATANVDVTEHGGDKVKKEVPFKSGNVFPCLPVKQRVTPVKATSQMISRDKVLFRNCNRNTYAKYKEHFILNKILKRSLKFSVLCPIEKMSRNFLLENESESFSQILNSNDPPNSSKSKLCEKHPQSVMYGESAACEKSIERIMGDKTKVLDNGQSIICEPFVRSASLTPAVFSPKCEVRLINYSGSALFWAPRNTAESAISCDSGFSGSAYSSTDCTNRSFINGVSMAVNSGNEMDSTNNKVYNSEVRLEVNSEEAERSPERKKLDTSAEVGNSQSEKDEDDDKTPNKDIKISKTLTNTENPCGRALRDLEDLKSAIQKAKETRMSASRELKLLQQLLHNPENEETETTPKRTTLAMSESKLSLPDGEIMSGNHENGKMTEALSELQQKSAKEASQNKEFWEEEIRKAKEEVSQVCQEKLSIMEEKLRTTEDELSRALKENTRLKDQLELRSAAFPVCKCNAEAQGRSDFSHMNGISDEDPKMISVVKPSIPTKNFWQEWDRLQSDLTKAERKADELNILLNQKLIELNRMQLTLSKQTKEMILLEKAYFQLRSHLSKKKLKSGQSHQSSSAAKTLSSAEGSSETSSKRTDPEIPP